MVERRTVNDPGHHVGDALSRVARTLQEEHGDVEGTLRAITAGAVATLPDAEECGISYVTGRARVAPRAATGELPRTLDLLQQQLGQGPCLDAVWDHVVVRVDDMPSEQRWPAFARQSAALGVGSMLCLQLFVHGDQLGAMNLYARTPGAFDDEAQEIGLLFASHAAVALSGAETEQHLRLGMSNRDLIGQAKGILMERHRLSADQAFAVLVRVSQETNRKLVDIARELADTGAMPDGPNRRD